MCNTCHRSHPDWLNGRALTNHLVCHSRSRVVCNSGEAKVEFTNIQISPSGQFACEFSLLSTGAQPPRALLIQFTSSRKVRMSVDPNRKCSSIAMCDHSGNKMACAFRQQWRACCVQAASFWLVSRLTVNYLSQEMLKELRRYSAFAAAATNRPRRLWPISCQVAEWIFVCASLHKSHKPASQPAVCLWSSVPRRF